MIKQRRGWIRIVEAVIAIMILAGFLSFVLISQNKKVDFSEYASNIESSIIREVSKDDNMRSYILEENLTGVNSYIKSIIPATFNFSSRICNIGDACGCLDCPLNKDVYADSAFIASSLSQYKPKQFKLFIWRR